MSEALKLCPFANCTGEIVVVQIPSDGYRAVCQKCDACGPEKATEYLAVEAWNSASPLVAAPAEPSTIIDGLTALTPDQLAVLDDFRKTMREEIIPAIQQGQLENAERVAESRAKVILGMHGTERSMHHAYSIRDAIDHDERRTTKPLTTTDDEMPF